MQDNHFALLVRQVGQRRTKQPEFLAAYNQPARIVHFLRGGASPFRLNSSSPASLRSHQVANPIGNAPGKVGFQAAGEPEASDVSGESNKNIMDGIFGKIHIVRQGNRQNQHVISVLLIDPAQRLPASLSAFSYK
jgi:hypothetical protein